MFENSSNYDYGLWPVVAFNIVLATLFVIGFLRPRRRVEWRSMGIVQAFIVALFAEMYGFPLTIYFLSGVLGWQLPVAEPFSHQSGHLWASTLGFGSSTALVLCSLGSYLVLGGFILLAGGWWQIYRARGNLVTSGLYRLMRHPQYTGIFLGGVGFLIQWPTLLTIILFPLVVIMYVRLSRLEEKEALENFGEAYQQYMHQTPAFIPGWRPKK